MQCSLVRTNISVMVSIAVFKTHVLCPDSRGSMFLLNVGWYPNFTFQVNIGLTSLDNDQLDAHLLYFTIRPPQSSTCFEHYMLVTRRLNRIDAASGIVLSVGGRLVHRTATDWEDDTRCCINTVQYPDDEHVMHETCRGLWWTYCKTKQVCIKLVIV